jgi:phage-related minor tail protein
MSGANAGNLVALFKIDSTGAQASMTAAEITTAKALESMKRQFIAVSARVKELEGGTKSLNANLNMAKATQEVRNFGQAAELSGKQLSRANQMLPAQISDIVVSLASGQQAWLVAIQQGAQIKDSYGGIANAARALASAFSFTRLAIGGVVGVLAGAAAGFYQGYKDSLALRDALALTGNAAGLTADRYAAFAQRVAQVSGQTVGASKEILLTLATTGRTSVDVIEGQAAAIARIADLSGKDGAKIAERFSAQLKAPAKFAAELNEQYNFLNIAQFKRIQLLEKEGKEVEAAKVTNDLLLAALADQRKNLGYLESSLETVTKKWSEFWNAVKGLGTDKGPGNALSSVRSDIDKILSASGGKDPSPGNASFMRLQQLRTQEMLLVGEVRRQAEAADQASRAAQENREKIEKAMGGKDKPAPTFAGAIQSAREQYRNDFGRSEIESYAEIEKAQRDAAERAAKDAWEIEKKNIEQMYRDEAELREKEVAAAKKHQAELAKHGQDQVKSFEDSVMTLVRNGKDGFKDLFNTMAEEFIRNMIRMAAQKTMLDSNGAFVGWGQSFSNAWGSAAKWFGGSTMDGSGWTGEHAGGLDYVPYDGYPAMLHKGERVQRAVEANSDRARGSSAPVQHVDNRVIVQGDVGAKALRAVRMGQNMQAARMASAERY